MMLLVTISFLNLSQHYEDKGNGNYAKHKTFITVI